MVTSKPSASICRMWLRILRSVSVRDLCVPKTCATWPDAPLTAGCCQRPRVRHMPGRFWPARAWDDLRLMGLKLIFLIVTRAMSLLGLSRRGGVGSEGELRLVGPPIDVAEL